MLEMLAGAAAGAALGEFFISGNILSADPITGKGGLSMEQKALLAGAAGTAISYFMPGGIGGGIGAGMVGQGIVTVLKENHLLSGAMDQVIAGPAIQSVIANARRRQLNGAGEGGAIHSVIGGRNEWGKLQVYGGC
jgi:hypothetical protein